MERWITTSEAARRLGVRRETLYAYVSRGVLVSRRRPGQLESLFDRTQVESLAAAKGAGNRAGERLLRFRGVASRVSAIHDGRLSYRGVDIDEVVATRAFREAALLVIGADDPEPAPLPPLDVARLRGARLERRIPLAVAKLAASTDPITAPERIPGVMCALGPAVDALLPEIPLDHPWIDAASTCLIDNGLAASAMAARVAASTRAGVLDALAAGLGALAGPLHGAAARSAHALIARVRDGADPHEAVGDHGAPGFGHVVYDDDPRAVVLLRLLRRDRPDARVLPALEALRRATRRPLNVDAVLGAIAVELELPAATGEVLFQRARLIGMAAHVAEEYGEAPLRWRGRADG